MSQTNTKTMVERGEDASARFLERRGMKILERGYKVGCARAAFVALDGDGLHFIQVNIENRIEQGLPLETLDSESRTAMEKLAAEWLRLNGADLGDNPICFDIISILVTSENRAFLRLHLNAFSDELSEF